MADASAGVGVKSPFHDGERAVHRRAGVTESADRIGGMVQEFLPTPFAAFMAAQPFAVLSSCDAERRVWCDFLTGPPGFARAIDLERVVLKPLGGEPIASRLRVGGDVGLLFIDFQHRQRIRINGTVLSSEATAISIRVTHAYPNCPKYIQAREFLRPMSVERNHTVERSVLTDDDRAFIGRSDTFFFASVHPEHGADASHRGGLPGFVRVLSSGELGFPDYAGNTMFNTLGNITVNPAVGLLFLDFSTGRALQLSGRASIVWSPSGETEFRGAERSVIVAVDAVVEHSHVTSLRWAFGSYSKFIPR